MTGSGVGVGREEAVASRAMGPRSPVATNAAPAAPAEAAPLQAPDPSGEVVAELRRTAQDIAMAQGRLLGQVSRLAVAVSAEARRELALGPRAPGQPPDEEVVRTCVANEVQVVLGVGEWSARELVELADRLCRVLPATLAALQAGRVDLARVRVLARAVEDLPVERARAVEALVLPAAGAAPWEGPSPRAWRSRVERAVARVDAEAVRRRRARAVRERLVRSWARGDGCADLLVTAAAEDVAMAEAVISDLAGRWPQAGPDGQRLSMDQRRVDALMDLLRRVRDGQGLPGLPVRRQREIGLVLGADTFFAPAPHDPAADGAAPDHEAPDHAAPDGAAPDGPAPDGPAPGGAAPDDAAGGDAAWAAAGDPGLVRGLGHDVFLDPVSAAEVARAELARGAALTVLLATPQGALARVVRLPRAPEGGWTRQLLDQAVRQALPDLPPLQTPGYAPTAAIEEQVRTLHPRCVWYDCPRGAHRCDLDHDQPWPRGPTDAANLLPRCRRNHETKTRRLHRSRAGPGGTVQITTLTGLTVTTRPEPLPGYGAGENHAPSG